MKIRKFMFVLCMVTMFILGACTVSTAVAEQNNPIKIWPQNENGTYSTLVVVDEDTGVNYIVVSRQAFRGSDGTSLGIAVRYNADGSLYISK